MTSIEIRDDLDLELFQSHLSNAEASGEGFTEYPNFSSNFESSDMIFETSRYGTD